MYTLRLVGWLLICMRGMQLWAAEDFSTINREALGHFWKAAEEKIRPVTVVSFGDSMADSYRSATYYLMLKFEKRLGTAGYSMNPYRNKMLYYLNDGAAIQPPSNIWFTDYLMLPPGGGIRYETHGVPGGILSDEAGLFFVAHPQGGLFTLSVSTNGGPWVTKLLLDGYSATLTGHFTNVALTSNLHQIRVDGVSGTNYILGPHLLLTQTSGVHVAFMERGGIALSQVTNVPLSIRNPVFAALKPDLLIWHMKEDGSLMTSNRMKECENWWANAYPACDVLYIGTPWVALDITTTYTLDHNQTVRNLAVSHNRAYVDLMQPGGSYESLQTNGLILADGVHLSAAGGQWGATIMWNDMNFFALGLPRRLALEPTNGLMRVAFPTAPGAVYGLQSSSNLLDWVPLLTVTGNGSLQATNISPAVPHQFYRLNLKPN
jgi:hypothetical protein